MKKNVFVVVCIIGLVSLSSCRSSRGACISSTENATQQYQQAKFVEADAETN